MKIIVDAYGGDFAPAEVVKGAVAALEAKEGFKAVLVGKEEGIREALSACGYTGDRVEIVNARDVISCEEAPTEAIRKKPDSSICRALKVLKEDPEAVAFVSAGSTGAVLTGAVLLTKRIAGVSRPALAPLLPTVKGTSVMLLDSGANVDCKAINLVQFALMGSAYMKEVVGVENPKVALLSNGTEEKKGCLLTHEVFPLLKERTDINFVGNMEARDILSGEYDVVVTDGFYGNIALKSTEGAVNTLFTVLKREIKASKKASVGALLMKGAFRNVKNMLDYNKRGGAVLLGMEKTVIKIHGASKAEPVKNAILQGVAEAESNLNEVIRKAVAGGGTETAV